jgi:ribokinase
VCIGDLVLDVVVRAEAELELGTDVPGSVRFRVGGSAANTARAFAGLGGASALICAVGSDHVSRRLLASVRAAGVTVHALRSRGPAARLLALLAAGGERSFVTDRGVADQVNAARLKGSWLGRADVLHLPAYSLFTPPLSDASMAAIRVVRAGGALVSIDLASRRPLLGRGVTAAMDRLAAAAPDVLLANVDEAAALVGRRHARRLLELAPIVAVKEGAAGCRVAWRAGADGDALEIEVATRPVAASDTTGAGDAFDAGFLHFLAGAGVRSGSPVDAALLRRAALAGHRAAARLLTSARPELLL